MKHTLIKTEKQYDEALERLNDIFDASPNSKEGQEAELLALLIESYEEAHHPIESPDPIVTVRIRMEELQLKQTVRMIRNLSERLKITPNVLIQDYDLN